METRGDSIQSSKHHAAQAVSYNISLTGCGREDCSNLHSWGPGVRSCHIIHYILRGAGFLECGQKTWRVEAGQSFLLYPYTVTRYYPDPEDPWEYTWVDFDGSEASLLLTAAGFSLSSPVFSALPSSRLQPLFERLCGLDIHYHGFMEANGLLLAILGVYADAFASSQEKAARPKQEDNRLSTALLLIQSSFHKPDFNVESLCSSMHINRVTLYRLFTDALGTPPNSYISRYRLEQAGKLLEMGFSVKETALSCGYADPFYFSRVFKAHAGMPPAVYRMQAMESEGISQGTKKPHP